MGRHEQKIPELMMYIAQGVKLAEVVDGADTHLVRRINVLLDEHLIRISEPIDYHRREVKEMDAYVRLKKMGAPEGDSIGIATNLIGMLYAAIEKISAKYNLPVDF